MTGRLIIVRHGNTFAPGEPPRRVGARTDLPLVPSGREQAERLGNVFASRGYAFDRILTSPLRRTRETAELIRSAQKSPPDAEPFDLLAEIDHGPDEDRSEAEVVARIGADALAAWDEDGIVPPGWIVNREARLAEWRELFASSPGGTTLLVTSNGAARFALLADAGLSAQAHALPSLKLRTGAFGIIEIGEGPPRLVAWNERP
jgi:broad specificity phosphatase PhoE